MFISKLLKSILYFFVLRIIYKFIKDNSLKYINIETIHEDDLYLSDENQITIRNNIEYIKNKSTKIVLYNNDIKNNKNKYDLKEIYNNFFNGIKKELKNDIDPEFLKNNFKKNDKPIKILKDNVLNLVLNKTNINNNLKWSFQTRNDKLYKLKCYLIINKKTLIHNIELNISDNNGNAFIYDYLLDDYVLDDYVLDDYVLDDYDIENNKEIDKNSFKYINNFSFILDNNYFDNNTIYITIDFKKNNLIEKDYIFDEVFIEVIEKNIINETPIIVLNVNEKSIPIYFNKNNILDLDEFEGDYFE